MPNKQNITIDNLNSENIKLINEMYKNDFRNFNYKMITV